MIKKILLLIVLLIGITNAFADPIERIVFFGDSLTDNGNLHSVLKIMPKSPPYYNGRFSNGLVWADEVGQYFLNKYAISPTNYAVGGATVELLNPFEGNLPYVLSQEISSYLFRTMFGDRRTTLFIIWIGANDYTGGRKDVEDATTKTVNSIMSTINRLIDHGGQYFLVLNLPDLSKIPYAKTISFSENLRLLSEVHNKKLEQAITKLQQTDHHIKISYLDTSIIFSELIKNPEKFNKQYNKNLKNTEESCWKGGYTLQKNHLNEENALSHELQKSLSLSDKKSQFSDNMARYLLKNTAMLEVYQVGELAARGVVPCEHPNEYIFWDKVHPTTDVHQILGAIIIKSLLDSRIIG